ncbi:unnamed protein product [Mytilus coruscus]|uniref:Peptidase aspartic putative domain-containing protein n=1 Tax=Mytilus coruscus TaxID=42192 RepID=A0A6J7ZW17_MYTCO|nr:unnamed protein product [Mytilus coruscus]
MGKKLRNNSVDESHEQVNKDNDKTELHSSLAPQKTSNVILKIAVASVISGTQSTDSNILLNEGAQRSFITEAFAKKLDLDPSSCITTLKFKIVLFGATCSPFILNAVLSKHINNHQTESTDNLKRDLYADNIVSSFNSEDELSQYFKVIRKLFADGGFTLRAWASNNKLLQQLAESEKVLDTAQVIKVLGLRWTTDQDTQRYAENILVLCQKIAF